MIQCKKDLKFYLFADNYMRYGGNKPSWIYRLVSSDIIPSYLISMRWTAYYNNCVGKTRFLSLRYFFHAIRFNRLGIKLGFSIGYNSLGYGVVIPHHGTIVVNGDATLGNYCVLHTSTCIAGGGKIGDGLYLSAGAIIVSPNLGDYVTIGANALLHKSEAVSNVFMVGSPATIKKENYSKWYDRDGWGSKISYIESYKRKIYTE